MYIEHLKEAVEAVLEREVDPVIWFRFCEGSDWRHEVVQLLAQLFDDEEAEIIQTLAEIDAEEAEIDA
jgi:hypothetical protein